VSEPLSFWSLVANAGYVVQIVMLILFAASMAAWAMIVQRFLYFRFAKAAMLAFENEFWSGVDLSELYKRSVDPEHISGTETIFRDGFKEYSKLKKQADADAVMEGCQRAMRVAMSREEEKLDTHLAFLATVASSSPYIGLFGTVWGIMNSFRSLANMQQATIATVAPGISEALIATAMGLFAAIPAVIAYNRYATSSDALLKNYQNFAEEFSSILHRQAHAKQQG
jgi:biopolymer transport protein TolQ